MELAESQIAESLREVQGGYLSGGYLRGGSLSGGRKSRRSTRSKQSTRSTRSKRSTRSRSRGSKRSTRGYGMDGYDQDMSGGRKRAGLPSAYMALVKKYARVMPYQMAQKKASRDYHGKSSKTSKRSKRSSGRGGSLRGGVIDAPYGDDKYKIGPRKKAKRSDYESVEFMPFSSFKKFLSPFVDPKIPEVKYFYESVFENNDVPSLATGTAAEVQEETNRAMDVWEDGIIGKDYNSRMQYLGPDGVREYNQRRTNRSIKARRLKGFNDRTEKMDRSFFFSKDQSRLAQQRREQAQQREATEAELGQRGSQRDF